MRYTVFNHQLDSKADSTVIIQFPKDAINKTIEIIKSYSLALSPDIAVHFQKGGNCWAEPESSQLI